MPADDDAPIGEEGPGLRGIDQTGDVEAAFGAVILFGELFDHERAVAIADELVHQLDQRVGQQRRVVADQQMNRRRR